eukprot:6197055-Pleurochrysis_carterae.AAC.3
MSTRRSKLSGSSGTMERSGQVPASSTMAAVALSMYSCTSESPEAVNGPTIAAVHRTTRAFWASSVFASLSKSCSCKKVLRTTSLKNSSSSDAAPRPTRA